MSEGAGQIVMEGYLKYGERGGEEDDIDLNSLLLDLGVDDGQAPTNVAMYDHNKLFITENEDLLCWPRMGHLDVHMRRL